MKAQNRKNPIPAIFLTVFIDMLGVGIIIPILAPLLLDPGDMLPGWSEESRNLIYGLLLGTFSVFQFLFAPLIGLLSDRYGRRPVLFVTLFSTLASYLLFAYGIFSENLPLLFIARAFSGVAAGNLAVIYSAIADVSDPASKAKNFGLVGVAFGIGFIIGPVLGGYLSDPDLISWFTFSTPFLFAALLVVINLTLVYFNFPETLAEKNPEAKVTVFAGFNNLFRAFSNPSLRSIFIVVFLLTFGFTFFTQFVQPFFIKRFGFDQTDIGKIFGFIGIIIAITQGLLVRFLGKKFGPKPLVAISTFFLVGAFLLLLIPTTEFGLYLVIPGVAVFQGIGAPNISSIVSNSAPPHLQGETLGMQLSVQSAAQMIPPILGGFFLSVELTLPIWLAAGVTLLAAIAFVWQFGFGFKEKPEQKS